MWLLAELNLAQIEDLERYFLAQAEVILSCKEALIAPCHIVLSQHGSFLQSQWENLSSLQKKSYTMSHNHGSGYAITFAI